jgi:hypothetical protein
MRRRRLQAAGSFALAVSLSAGIAASAASAGSEATKSGSLSHPGAKGKRKVRQEIQPPAAGEALVRYTGPKKLKVKKKISFSVVCSVACTVTARLELVLPGPNLGPATVSGTLLPGQTGSPFIKPNGTALKTIKQNIKKSKLRTTITAVDQTTGEQDVDKRTFKFKK